MKAIAVGKAEFNRAMLDYPSARFRDVRATVLHGQIKPIMCGFVNGKNRMGAYAGWTPFALSEVDGEAFLVMDDPKMVEIFCRIRPERDIDTKDYSADLSAE